MFLCFTPLNFAPLQPNYTGRGVALQLFGIGDPRLNDPVATDNHLAVLPYPIRTEVVAVLAGVTQGMPVLPSTDS
ncbi:hypothetical protein [Serratia symbiotica]|uniref:hypothetical protein n=1 Tax=Serratia symbiotica TaxID=138074 RepID=UPI003F5B3F97